MRVRARRATAGRVRAACAGKAQGKSVEAHDAVCASRWPPDSEPAAGPVKVGQAEASEFDRTERVDGDQRDSELRRAGGCPVEQAAEPVGRQRLRQPAGTGDGNAAGRIAEDQALAFERAEQRPQRGLQAQTIRTAAVIGSCG
jgi:hypothetical protein